MCRPWTRREKMKEVGDRFLARSMQGHRLTPFFAPQSKTHPTMQGPLASTVTPYERGRRFLKPGESMRSGEAMTSVDCKSKLVRMRERRGGNGFCLFASAVG